MPETSSGIFAEKMSGAIQLIQAHNNNPANSNTQVDMEAFLKKLQEEEVNTAEDLKTWDYLRLKDAGLPRELAVKIAEVFEAEEESIGELLDKLRRKMLDEIGKDITTARNNILEATSAENLTSFGLDPDTADTVSTLTSKLFG